MSAVIEEHGAAEWCKIKSFDQFVANISAEEIMNYSSLKVEVDCSVKNKGKIAPLNAALEKAAGGVPFEFEVKSSIGVGASMGVIEN